MSEQRGKRGRPRTGHRVALSAILPACRFIGCDDIVAGGCHDAAGQVRPGDVYVARCTATGDGHEAIGRAIARGAVGIVAERIVATAGVPLCVVRDGNWAFARLTQALAGDPARRLKVIAVTGTSGKTTTAWLTAAVLAEAGLEVGVLSDLGCLGAGDDRPVAVDLTRPARLAEWLGRLAAGGCTHAVVEVSSRMLAAQALAGVACDTVVVTNLGTAHLDEHGTRRAYHALKGRLVAGLGERGCLVSGVRGGKLARLLARAPRGTNCLTAGLAADCDVQARSLERGLAGRTFLLAGAGESVPVATTTPVVPFVRDAVLAAAVGARYGVPLATAARGLEAAGAVPGRVERVDRGQDAAVFIDQPTSGHALAATLASLRRLTPGRLAVLAEDRVAGQLGGRGFAAGVGRWCDACTIVPATVLDEDAGKEAVAAYARVDRLLSTLGPRDCLLVLGAAPLPPLPPDGGEPSYRPAVATLVDAWLRLAHPPVAAWGRAA